MSKIPEQQRKLSVRLLQDVVGAERWRYGLFVAFSILFGLVALLPPELFRFFTENTQKLSNIDAVQFVSRLGVFGVLVATALLLSSFGNVVCQEWIRLRLEAHLRRKVLRRLHELPLTALDGAQRGDWITRMSGDLGQTEAFLTDSLPRQARDLAVVIGSGSLFLLHSGALAAFPLVTAAVLALINVQTQRRLAPTLAELRSLHGGILQMLIESLEGLCTIRTHSVEPFVQRRFEVRLGEITRKSLRVVRTLGALIGGTGFASQFMVTVSLTAVAWARARGTMSVEEILFYPFFLGLFYGAVQDLAAQAYSWNRYFTEGGRLAELVYPTESQSRILLSTNTAGHDFGNARQLIATDIAIGYDGTPLVGPINFTLNRSKLWAVMGPSGSGKSTFLEVLAGLRPARQGTIEIRGAGSKLLWQTKERSPEQFPAGALAYVQQQPYIFEGTLRENLVFGNIFRLSDGNLWEALERLGLTLFTKTQGGLDCVLHDRGCNMSQGERYRIALCRAILLKRPFLLLDEPFAALDGKSISLVISNLLDEKSHSGIVVVTHSLPEDLAVDGVLSFDGGATASPTTFHRDIKFGRASNGGGGSLETLALFRTLAANNNNQKTEERIKT